MALTFSDGKISSYVLAIIGFGVGTLGNNNHNKFREYIRKARSRKRVMGIIIAGDLNMLAKPV